MKLRLNISKEYQMMKTVCAGIIITFFGMCSLRKVGSMGVFNDVALLIFLFGILIYGDVHSVNKPACYLGVLGIIGGICGNIYAYLYWGNFELSDLYRSIMISIRFIIFFGIKWNTIISYKEHKAILKLIVFEGVLAMGYALLEQHDLIRECISGNAKGWFYRSFFSTRNQFASLCMLSIFAAAVLYKMTKKITWILLIFLFISQIFLTNSRNALLSVIIFGMGIIWFKLPNKDKIMAFIFAVFLIALIPIIVNVDAFGGIRSYFYHENSTYAGGGDSTRIRFDMWKEVIRNIAQSNSWIMGCGINRETKYLFQKFGLGSAHNAYVDMIYGGGIIWLLMYVYMILASIKNTCINMNKYRNIYFAIWAAISFHGLFDTFCCPLMSSYYSYLVIILVVFIPKSFAEEEVYDKERVGREKIEGNLIGVFRKEGV